MSSKSFTLYQLADQYLQLAQAMRDTEVPDEVVDKTLAAASGDIEHKAWNITALMQEFEGQIAMMKLAEQRMAFRRKSLEKRTETLRQYLLQHLCRVGIFEIETPEFAIRVYDNPPRVILDDEDLVPAEYKEEEVVVSVRKDELRRAMLEGEIIPGAHLERSQRLAIK
ncbi:siphovirus Gp157 family protein [Vogesella fluminis]|nr:siphovirus Gp157 family protein [Vogesella fluminis]